jgi:phenylpyruvate tautomerase PptA (4-oxalocrotonate tautomerase family)
MPLVRLSIQRGRTPEQKRAIADAVYEAMREAINIPENDRFILVDEKAPEDVFMDSNFMSDGRTTAAILVEITLRAGRTDEMKASLYRRIAERIGKAENIADADIMVVLHENQSADWSFSGGVAQFLR